MSNCSILTIDAVEHVLSTTVRSYLHQHGGDVACVSIEKNVITLKFKGTCVGCPASFYTFSLGIEKALKAVYPDVVIIILEDDE